MKELRNKIDAIVAKSKEFRELYGDDLFNEIYNMKKALAVKIDGFNVCSQEKCKAFEQTYIYSRCCFYCDVTHGALRHGRIPDIISEEDSYEYIKKYAPSQGYKKFSIGCTLETGFRGLVCASFFCNRSMLSDQQIQIVNLFVGIHVLYSDILKHKYEKQVAKTKFVVVKEVMKNIEEGVYSTVYSSYLTAFYARFKKESTKTTLP